MAHKFKSPILKFSEMFTLQIEVSEFKLYAEFLDPNANATEIIEHELYHCWNGIVNGSKGGEAIDWKAVLYRELYKAGHIKQTDLGVITYGDFSKSL